MKLILRLIASLIFLIIYTNTFANNLSSVGRYLTVENKAKSFQSNLLLQTIQIRFPRNVQNIEDAMNHILRLSGYSLISTAKMNSPLKITLSKALPAVDRELGPMPLKDALSVLAGPALYLVHDPLNRIIDFRVKPQYADFYKNSSKFNLS